MILIRASGQASALARNRSIDSGQPLFLELSSWWRDTCGLIARMLKGQSMVTMILVSVLVLSGIATVYAVHLNRQLFMELQVLQADKDKYEREWTQLLLEESAWSAHGRVEQIAIEEFGMVTPDSSQLEIIK